MTPVSTPVLTSAAMPAAISVLYVFAGKARHNDILSCLVRLAPGTVNEPEVDLIRGPLQDVLHSELWDSIIKRVNAGEFDVIIWTPPCNPFSRAIWNDNKVARLRDFDHPMGYPWPAGLNKAKCWATNQFVHKTFELAGLSFSVGAFFWTKTTQRT